MNRYQDNTSPEPNIGLNLNDCYKTPNVQQYSSLYPINQLYPTPPSDNDSSPVTDNSCKISSENFSTPVLSYYDQNSFNSESQDGSFYRKISQEEKNVQSNMETKPSSTSRFKRRSRTTYTKTQLDALEATFQKTHYPEIRVVDDLSSMLNLSTERISIWFQNRRARFKKARKLETQENRMALENVNQVPVNNYAYPTGYPITNYQNLGVVNQENFSRNLFNSFAPIQDDQNSRVPLANHLNKSSYYGQVLGMQQQQIGTQLGFYQNNLSTET